MQRNPKLTRRGREMTQVLADLDRSGLSVHEFAAKRGISQSTLWYWRRRLRSAGARSPLEAPLAPLVEVAVLEDRPRHRGFRVEILPDRRVVEVPAGFDARDLHRLLEVLLSC